LSMMSEDIIKDGEIVGLGGTTNGRCCARHACCGEHLRPNDYVRFRYVKLDFGRHTEDEVKAVKLWEGMETCTVGFLPRYVVQTRGSEFVNKVAIVLELYEYSHNSTMRSKSHCQVFALARLCVFLLLAH
jgi:hypothetical protein